MRVLRVYHSAVVTGWRQRDRMLRSAGVGISLVTARRWNEGGSLVGFTPDGDEFVTSAATRGSRPNLFAYDPRPIWRRLGDGPFDVLDFHEEPCSLAMAELLTLRALRARRTPFTVYSAQNLVKRYPPPFRWIERWCLGSAGGAYPCNEAAGEILRAKGFRGVLATLPLGVDVERFSPAPRTGPTGDGLRIGYVGRLAHRKGVHVVLRAIAALPGTTLDIVGDGPDADGLRELTEELGLTGRVRFLGYLDQHDLPDFYRTLDVVTVPSIPVPGWDEQFCRVAVEAMASGVPVVASASGALPEVVGEGGLLVPPDDVPRLTDALRRLVEEPSLWRALRSAALGGVDRFAWSSVAAAHATLYRDVLRRDRWTAGRTGATPAPVSDVIDPHVLIVAYGPPEGLAATLDRLGGAFPVTVVDNSSSPATRDVVEAAGAMYVDPGSNLGFASGVNVGLRTIGPDPDVLLLNPDATIDPGSVRALVRVLDADPSVAAVAPTLVHPVTGRAERVTWPFPGPAQAWWEALRLSRYDRSDTFLIGAVLLLRGRALAEVGAFDERFFLYAEEADWQLRARSAGWHLSVCTEVTATHEGAGTGGDPTWREEMFHASGERFVRKWYGDHGWNIYRWAKIVREIPRSVLLGGPRGRDARRRLHLYLHRPSLTPVVTGGVGPPLP